MSATPSLSIEAWLIEQLGKDQSEGVRLSAGGRLAIWNIIAKWTDNDPFIGFPICTYRSTLQAHIQELYNMLQKGPTSLHPCKPPDVPLLTLDEIPFAKYKDESYTKGTVNVSGPKDDSVARISQRLYRLMPQISTTEGASTASFTRSMKYFGAVENMVALICHEIVGQCSNVRGALSFFATFTYTTSMGHFRDCGAHRTYLSRRPQYEAKRLQPKKPTKT